ncbi:methionine--tRNA ligase [Chlamydia abortus]|uniref:Methionine--tRNA ligase n=1 Tax=Chlamydia abortus (strain DSM 27085 / S26/3) TaxID=218497 RepID=SYM_CHLAB|nr:methionine--tRNA ligase [Chlamydia abortus]Q5L5M3.1 RecName: Full=Methionine--tRNA ligase; AltName: Full=Methionyl-tRNA synthetase; Short=MetRS [Chlamydia abortus S26/3]ASD30748.1 methionine--tRNA ligase [Chlamydia abortus]AUS60097.1 methionyl-tRNA synthetase [Chlamydia abortus]CAH64068.1 methionyl-tRNA synthetase [Chlamydia abortus S26/3]CED80673.1 methionyl-tRNA synthetase [Chlamydia abortus]SFV97135.1 methionyl-tRNA synthetase [Chlamydia abortus]
MPSRVLITSALPYANGPLHFGHIAGAYLPADVYARFRRLLGDDVLYICGSDEYGIAITLNAERAGMGYQEYVNMYHKIHKDTFDKLGISIDFFSRTTNPFHKKLVQDFYTELQSKGLIENQISLQLYSEEENRFLADRYVEGTCPKCGFDGARGDECQKCGADYEATDLVHPRSKLSGSQLVLKETEHAFLHLERMVEPLLAYIDTCYLPEHIRKFVTDYIKNLRPRAITRDLSWGIPVPDFPNKVFYVWFDAPIGYISGTMDWAASLNTPEAWKDFWLEDSTEYVQFIGKDNIPFHAAIFPAMELGQSIPYKKMDALVSSEFYLLEGCQFSKSEGNYIDIDTFLDTYSLDKLRYVLAATAPETSDSEFTFMDFKTRCNSELVGKFGNFIHRVLVFAEKNGFKELAYSANLLEDQDKQFLDRAQQIVRDAQEHYSQYSLRKACCAIMELAALGNVYFNDQAPWKLLKEGLSHRVEAVLFCACYCQKLLALISYPIIPGTAWEIWRMLSPKSLQLDSLDKDRVVDLWNRELLNFSEEVFSLTAPQLLFTIVD